MDVDSASAKRKVSGDSFPQAAGEHSKLASKITDLLRMQHNRGGQVLGQISGVASRFIRADEVNVTPAPSPAEDSDLRRASIFFETFDSGLNFALFPEACVVGM